MRPISMESSRAPDNGVRDNAEAVVSEADEMALHRLQ